MSIYDYLLSNSESRSAASSSCGKGTYTEMSGVKLYNQIKMLFWKIKSLTTKALNSVSSSMALMTAGSSSSS